MIEKLFSVKQYPVYLEILWGRIFIKNLLRIRGVNIAERGRLFGIPIVSLANNSKIVIGKNCDLRSTPRRTALGVNHPVILRTICPGASIIIGDDTGISGGVICAAKLVQIGRECLIGANVTIADTDFHPINSSVKRYEVSPDVIPSLPVIVEDNVFIGTGAIILKGVTIGRNSVVGAGSVVTKSIPENTIVAGNPAKVIKKL